MPRTAAIAERSRGSALRRQVVGDLVFGAEESLLAFWPYQPAGGRVPLERQEDFHLRLALFLLNTLARQGHCPSTHRARV